MIKGHLTLHFLMEYSDSQPFFQDVAGMFHPAETIEIPGTTRGKRIFADPWSDFDLLNYETAETGLSPCSGSANDMSPPFSWKWGPPTLDFSLNVKYKRAPGPGRHLEHHPR